ncbi:MAG: acyl-CoA thioesterase [Proteobacteria bacterium]|nr:acyl-CoA thioesterase [Pseudomonadota bacterium]
MDAFGHVNNIIYFRYFENARLAYFERIRYRREMEETGVGPILALTSCRFRYPLEYPDTVYVGARVATMEAERFVMEYRVVSLQAGVVAAEGEGLVVSYDYRGKKKTPLPELMRARIAALEGGIPS